jgi:hypothetical protein
MESQMPSDQNLIETYYQLSSLYKNPTRPLKGMAASNQDKELDTELANEHKKLLRLFRQKRWSGRAEKPALYFKVLSLLYEVDDYRGVLPSVEELILTEHLTLIEQFNTSSQRPNTVAHQTLNFKNPEVRSRWKAKVLCCVAAIESGRKRSPPSILLRELTVLENFIKQNLHNPKDSLPAWTTLAFVRAAQARVARRSQMYSYMREKLLSVVQCLDQRAAEIIEKLSALREQNEKTQEVKKEIEKLDDDLVFIRRKQTLSTSFNVGLAELQRGSLRIAAYACQAAQLEFRLHGQLFHRLFNELLMLSIKRGQLSKKNLSELFNLKDQLEQDILPLLKPEGHAGNPKLYLYGLREKAVIQYYCGKFDDMLDTLKTMEEVGPLSPQWSSRISNQRARAHWHLWSEKPRDMSLLQTALDYSDAAFQHASGLSDRIGSYNDTESLIAEIEGSESRNLIDTLESLITYGDVQVGRKDTREATKSAGAVIELCKDDNPRLRAMGHLVMAEAQNKSGLFVEANQHLASAKILERQIDHKYVADRIRSIEQLGAMREVLDLSDCKKKEFSKAEDLLLGWFIEHRSHMNSINDVADELGMNRKKINDYLERLSRIENHNSPFRHLLTLKDKHQNKRREKT